MHPRSSLFAALVVSTLIASGGKAEAAAAVLSTTGEAPGTASAGDAGTVYALSNDPAGNAVVTFARAPDGTLSPAGSFSTGGTGTGAALGSQGALTFSRDGRWALAVNAGSDDVSIFAVSDSGSLRLVDRAPSGGDVPISVTVVNDLVFVVNAGVPNSVTGLRIGQDGDLQPIPSSTRPLSAADSAPAEIAFDPGGDFLVVTEKNTNRLSVYAVGEGGNLDGPRVVESSGQTPFGFAFTRRGLLVVSEAGGSTVSSYRLSDDVLDVVTASAPNFQIAACWIAITADGRFAYSANTGADDISAFAIAPDGTLALLDASGVAASAGDAPADLAMSRGSGYLYVRNGRDGSISGYGVQSDGALEQVELVSGLPAGSAGLAAR
ncbi:beta-propeller fold lactonase family protein [Anaeromyxobacter sp. SG66]|uniref:lactonase family protein n=1 Tax=Anaeromyxobacter sp. SG66 TaxID=2925410 RepID=UPI001F5A86DA|nr:beta-propeller fold lactonase family protein [Anaeromyxobacter sp. SG66]